MKKTFYYFLVTICLFVVISFLNGTSTVYAADQCSDILRDGVFNKFQSLNIRNYSAKFKEAILNSTENTSNSSQGVETSMTIPIEGVPVTFGGNYEAKEFQKIKTKYKSNTSLELQEEDFNWIVTHIASKDILEAWSKCKTEQQSLRGLKANLEEFDDKKFNLRVRWEPVQNVPFVFLKDFIVSGAKCDPRILIAKTKIGTEFLSQPCMRDSNESVQITINVLDSRQQNAGSGTPKLDAILPPKIEFSADPGKIQAPNSSILSWNVADAATVTITPETNVRPAVGQKIVKPDVTTTYVLTAKGRGGISSASATVEVIPKPPVTRIISVFAVFHTKNDDKDEAQGISEVYKFNGNIIGSNNGWGSGLTFRNSATDTGQTFGISVPLDECKNMKYEYHMLNDDGWKVEFEIKGKLSTGAEVVLARTGEIKIANGSPRDGSFDFCR